jgi:hypothetical protein
MLSLRLGLSRSSRWIFRFSDAYDQHDFIVRSDHVPIDAFGLGIDWPATVIILLPWLMVFVFSFALYDIIVRRPTLWLSAVSLPIK